VSKFRVRTYRCYSCGNEQRSAMARQHHRWHDEGPAAAAVAVGFGRIVVLELEENIVSPTRARALVVTKAATWTLEQATAVARGMTGILFTAWAAAAAPRPLPSPLARRTSARDGQRPPRASPAWAHASLSFLHAE
jgi:hypothetical protein